jgi:tryptophan halogenase
VANQREDGEIWRYFRELTLPDSLQEKIDAWMTRGFIIKYEFGVFLPPSWIAVLLGQNQQPRGYDRRVDQVPSDVLARKAAAVREEVRNAAQATPEHFTFINEIGAASSRAPLAASAAARPQ